MKNEKTKPKRTKQGQTRTRKKTQMKKNQPVARKKETKSQPAEPSYDW